MGSYQRQGKGSINGSSDESTRGRKRDVISEKGSIQCSNSHSKSISKRRALNKSINANPIHKNSSDK